MALVTPVGIAGYTSGALRPKTKVSQNGVSTSSIGGVGVNPTGQYRPQALIGTPKPGKPKTSGITRTLGQPGTVVPPGTKPKPLNPIGPGGIKPIKPKPGAIKPGDIGNGPGGIGKPVKKAPSWQDADYDQQMRAIERALNLYKTQMGTQRTRAGTQYAESGREMDESKVRDLSDMENDFASRGIVTSGVYGTSVGDYNTEWGTQRANLASQYKDALADISANYTEYLNDIQTQKEEARLAAIRRRAQELELNPAKPKKKASTIGRKLSSASKKKPSNIGRKIKFG